jgi:hypothetical protein
MALRATESDENPKLWGGRPRPRPDPQVRPAEPGGLGRGSGDPPHNWFFNREIADWS